MGDWPLLGDGQRYEAGQIGAASRGKSAIGSATPHTKGTYAEMVTASAFDSVALLVQVFTATASADFLLDVAIGGAGSETVVIPDLLLTGPPNVIPAHLVIPLAIPAATRVSARCQSSAVSGILHCVFDLVGCGFLPSQPLGRVTAYGPNTADSGAVSVDPGAVANTKGAWTEITSSTTNHARYLMVAVGNQVNAARPAANWMLDIGIGAADSEQVLLTQLSIRSANAASYGPMVFPPLPVSIPSGTRIAARMQSNLTGEFNRTLDVACYGID